jgi:hypothetical protein
MNHAKSSFSTEMFAGAIISVVQYWAPLWYMQQKASNDLALQCFCLLVGGSVSSDLHSFVAAPDFTVRACPGRLVKTSHRNTRNRKLFPPKTKVVRKADA